MLALAFVLALTAQQWRVDIDFLAAELPKRHANAFAHTTQAEFTARLEQVKADVDHLSDAAVAIRLQQAVASLRDAHSEVDIRIGPWTVFPIRVARFGDDLVVTRTSAATRDLCAARLVAIDGVAADDAYARVATTISAENDAWLSARVPLAMTRAETLDVTGVTVQRSRARFTFERGGVTFDADVDAVPIEQAASLFGAYPSDASSPLYLQHPEQRYWFVYDAARRLLYVKYNVCQNDPARPFSAFARDLFAVADREIVDRFVIDLRNNTGGSSSVIQPLLDGIAQRSSLRSKLFAIIGRETFSSGMINALDLRKAGALLVGEPTGGKPNAYGEVLSFPLPNSRVTVFYSTKFFQLVPNDPPSVDPDVRVEVAASDFFNGRDPVLDAIAPLPASFTWRATALRRRASVTPSFKCD